MSTAPLLAPLPRILTPKSINLLSGSSGVGKTAFIAGLCRAFVDQQPIFGHTPHPLTGLGYVTADRYWEDSRQWFDAAGLDDIRQYSVIDDPLVKEGAFRNPYGGPAMLEKAVEQLALPAGSLIIIDPIALFLGGNLNDYRAVYEGCFGIRKWLVKQRYCLIGICHTAKLKADKQARYARPQDRIHGTGGLLAFTDTQMYLFGPEEADDPQATHHTFLWNPHHHKQQTFVLTRDDATGLFQFNAGTATAPQARIGLDALPLDLQSLYALIPEDGGVISAPKIAEQFSPDKLVDRSTIWRRLKSLESAGWILKDEGGRWCRRGL